MGLPGQNVTNSIDFIFETLLDFDRLFSVIQITALIKFLFTVLQNDLWSMTRLPKYGDNTAD